MAAPDPRTLEFTLNLRPLRGESLEDLVTRLAVPLKEWDAEMVNLIVFGSLKAHAPALEAMRRTFGRITWPITWVEGATSEAPITGLQAFAISGRPVQPILREGTVVGCAYENAGLRHCLLGGMGPKSAAPSRFAQTEETIEAMHEAFAEAGFSFRDVVRTWFYNEDILAWYGEFNQARNSVYSSFRFRTGSLPASTGVQGRNPAGTALTVAAWAVQPRKESTGALEVASPLQCPAPAYGSSFSRAMEIRSDTGRRLLISGTASIEPGGQTVWPGDMEKQVELTMDVVEGILKSRGFGFQDLTRATAYFKHAADMNVFTKWCEARKLPAFPAIPVHCDICRDDLLFELEADAWRALPVDLGK